MNPREIDAKIAERVMGWKLSCRGSLMRCGGYFRQTQGGRIRIYKGPTLEPFWFEPSTSISDAFLVLSEFPEVAILKRTDDVQVLWQVRTATHRFDGTATEWHESLPLAICEYALNVAALRAVDSDNEKTL